MMDGRNENFEDLDYCGLRNGLSSKVLRRRQETAGDGIEMNTEDSMAGSLDGYK